MNIVGLILIGGLMIGGGVLLLKYNYQVANNLRISFAEQHMGGGGSYLLWKIIAGLIIIAGFITMFGFHDNVIGWMLSPLTNSIGS